MTKATKTEKKSGSDTNKQSFVIQKGISRSGRAIKPKKFGDMVTETIKQSVNKNDDKGKVLKKVTKTPKKIVKTVVTNKGSGLKKEKAVKKPKTESSKKASPASSPIPKGFTPVDITAIISAKPQNDEKPKTVVAKVVAVSQANKVNNVTKTIVLSPIKKQMTYEEREKEIKLLRARLQKLEAEQAAERITRTPDAIKTPQKIVKIVRKTPTGTTTKTILMSKTSEMAKVVEQPIIKTIVVTPKKDTTSEIVAKEVKQPATKTIFVSKKETNSEIVAKVVKQAATKTIVASKKEIADADNRPARVKKPTWKAMEQD